MTLELAMEALLESGPVRRTRVTRDEVVGAVLRHFGVGRRELAGRSRTKDIVLPRQVAMYLCKALTHASLPEIGRSFGGKHHSTVIHSIRKIEDLRQRDGNFNSLINSRSRFSSETSQHQRNSQSSRAAKLRARFGPQ